MAGPQSARPRGNPASARKRFSLQAANATLPLVSRVVSDIVSTHARATELQGTIEQLKGREQEASRDEMERCWQRLQDYVDELTEIGCELKDLCIGLVDFVARHQGRDVYLCWKLGEAEIGHYHELDGGFAGRRPVSELSDQ